jgi:prepilin-type N-terminal cleavage/methylation domain-containing protein
MPSSRIADSRISEREPSKVLGRDRHGQPPRFLQSGFSLLELVIVIAILMVVAGMSIPHFREIINLQRLQSSARTYATFLQQARYRSTQDAQWYEVLADNTSGTTPIVYLDLNGNGQRDASEPAAELPAPVTISDTGVPTGFSDATLLGATPLNLETTPQMVNQNGTSYAGLAFNERGLPCQRHSSTTACTNSTDITVGVTTTTVPVAWVTYLQYPRPGSGMYYSAITITPAGRIKCWTYLLDGLGGGSWK